MVKDTRHSPAPARSSPAAHKEKQAPSRPRKTQQRSPARPAAQTPGIERTHAQFPDPEPPPDRVWEDRAG
jgi:hypothetical protein